VTDPEDLTSRDFRLWLLGQTDRADYTGSLARLVLGSACCADAGDERALREHMRQRHRERDAVAVMRAATEWRTLNFRREIDGPGG
jgi:hypothetical protein